MLIKTVKVAADNEQGFIIMNECDAKGKKLYDPTPAKKPAPKKPIPKPQVGR
jgi:hypothetical protein